jgi:hypothetical protein
MRRELIRTARPSNTQRASEFLIALLAGSGESVNLAALMDSHLSDDVGRATKAIYPKVIGFLYRARHYQRSIPNQARAQQGCGFYVAVRLVQWKTKSRFGDGEFGVAAIDGVAGEPRVVTQVFPIGPAVLTLAASPTKPRDPNPRSDPKLLDLGTAFHNFSDYFVARNERKFWVWQFPVHDVQVRSADGAG